MALKVIGSSDMQPGATSTYSLQQSSSINQAPTSDSSTISPADQNKLMTLLNSEADNSNTSTGKSVSVNHFTEGLLIALLALVSTVLLIIYKRLAIKFLNR